jgi:hypothetical protein
MQSNGSARQPANGHRETAASRRLRKFLTAAAAFDCETSEEKFRSIVDTVVLARRGSSDIGDDGNSDWRRLNAHASERF